MFTPAEKAERREQALALLAERALALACDLQEAALATSDVDEKARLAQVFAKVSRAVRQTFWLDARLDADLQRRQAEAEARSEEVIKQRHAARKKHVRLVVERAVGETFDDEDGLLMSGVDERVDEEAFAPDFDDAQVDVIIARLCREYGIEPPGPAPSNDPGFAPAPYQSSA